MRTTHHGRHRFAQNADHFAHNSPFSAFFTEVVCTLRTTPPRTAASLPANGGGNCTNRGATRRRHAEGRPLMAQNPHQRCGTTRRSRRASEEPESVGGAGERRRARAGPQDAGQTEAPEGGRRSPDKFRMQFSPSNNHRESKIRRISTIRFQYLKYAQGNCMRN